MKNLQIGKRLHLSNKILYAFYDDWASSVLKLFVKLPGLAQYCKVKHDDDASVECQETYAEMADLAKCSFSAYRAQDHKTDTAWCEGVEGDGVGEVILTHVDTKKPILIWTGYGKSLEIFKSNNRPKRIKIWILTSPAYLAPSSTESGGNWPQGGPKVVQSHEVDLQDINDFQKINIPVYEIGKNTSFLSLQILSVYPGSKFQDTCISEIKNN